MEHFDLIVIGGGPAGYMAAERAGAAGLSVVLLEKRALGGVCLNEGCIPSKALLHSAKLYGYAKGSEKYGVTAGDVQLDHGVVLRRKNKVVKKLVAGVGAKMRQHGITVVNAAGTVTGKDGDAYIVAAGDRSFAAKKLLLAAGGAPILPPLPGVQQGLESGFVLTSREILDLPELPQTLVVIGGGVVGLEMASYFNAVGCQVNVVEMLGKIAGPTEREASDALHKTLAAQGILFHLECRVTALTEGQVSFEGPEGTQHLAANKVLLSIGRRPACEELGLESIGVDTQNGAVCTNEYMQTNLPGVYAAGDINGNTMLAHTAYREAEVAVNHMLGRQDAMRYNAIPSVIYTNPEVACVGETEESCAQKGIPVQVAKLPLAYAGRYVAEVERGDGFCKLLMDTRSRCLVGAHIVGSYASEIIYGVGMMIENKTPVEDLQKLVFPHPTVGEIVKEVLFTL